eukprot:GHVR01026686.1.p2 GENE.GHVR01026686.1~~GHVR01026686.1.p2  ORF type:complete len:129 (+),score=25.78 GHVR01026686.1:933-1319(+)
MVGFYKKIKEAWNNVRDALAFTKRELNPYDELCSRFSTNEPIKISELGYIERLCKLISEPGCERKIEDMFGILRGISEDKGKMDKIDKVEESIYKKSKDKKKRKRRISKLNSGESDEYEKIHDNMNDS